MKVAIIISLFLIILTLFVHSKLNDCKEGLQKVALKSGACDTPYHCFIDTLNQYNFSDNPVDGDTSAQQFITSPVTGKTKNLLDTIMELCIHSYPKPPPNIDFSSGILKLKDNNNNVLASVSKGCGGKNGSGYKFLGCTSGAIWYAVPTQGYPYCMFGGDYPNPPQLTC